MIVTDLEYGLENRLVKKLDLMIDRCERAKPVKDSWMIVEGGEGEGKTSASLAIAYYVKYKTGRDIHLFLKTRLAMDFAKKASRKIIIIDEPSLDLLKGDSNNALNKDFKRFMATCRAKQHFVITNLTRFYIFNEYLVVDRCLGLVHMYSRKEIEPGRFVYIKKSNLEMLYRLWNSKHIRGYREYKSFSGTFPEIIEKHFDKLGVSIDNSPNCTKRDYDRIKNEGIGDIGEKDKELSKKEIKDLKQLRELKVKIALYIKRTAKDQELAAQSLGIPSRTINFWSKLDLNAPITLENADLEGFSSSNININGVDQEKNGGGVVVDEPEPKKTLIEEPKGSNLDSLDLKKHNGVLFDGQFN